MDNVEGGGGGNNGEGSSRIAASQQAINVIQPQHPQQLLRNEGQQGASYPPAKKPRLAVPPVHVTIPVHVPSGKVLVSTSAITAAAVASMSSSTTSSHPPPSSLPVTTLNGFRINSFNIHRLLITCLMVAAKFTSDLFYSNARYAKVQTNSPCPSPSYFSFLFLSLFLGILFFCSLVMCMNVCVLCFESLLACVCARTFLVLWLQNVRALFPTNSSFSQLAWGLHVRPWPIHCYLDLSI